MREFPSGARGERGLSLVTLLLALLVLIGGASALLYTFGQVVLPGQVGVRQIIIGPGHGYHRYGLRPGLHWNIPWYSKIHLIPTTLDVLDFWKDLPEERVLPAVDVPTSDGQIVDLHLSVVTRVHGSPGAEDGLEHGGPAELIQTLGLEQSAWRNHVARETQDVLKRSLRPLSSTDFFDPSKREAVLESALRELRAQLAPVGIGVDQLLFRRYTYRSHKIDIDGAIFRKNLQEVERVVAERRGKLAEVESERAQVEALWDAKVKSLRNEGDNRAIVIRSEADLYLNKKRAEGDLEVARVSAEVDRMRAAALAKSDGAELYVASKMAPLLATLRGGVVKDLDPYDIRGWMRRLGVTSAVPSSGESSNVGSTKEGTR